MSRISPATMTAAIFAILIGLVGAYGVRQYLSQAEPEPEVAEEQEEPTMVYVPVAARDMVVGQEVALGDIIVKSFEEPEFGSTEYVGKAFMRDTEQIVGKKLQSELEKGAVFMPDAFYPEGMGPSVTRLLKPGYRAVTIPVKNVGAVEGFATPGTAVDVLFRSTGNDKRPEVTLTLLEMVEVLAVDRNVLPGQLPARSDDRRPATVTLGVSPEQAKALKAVEDRGELSLALRHPDDSGSVVPAGVESGDKMTVDRLLGVAAEPKPSRIEIYRGGQRNEYVFNDSSEQQDDILNGIETPIRAERSIAAVSSNDVEPGEEESSKNSSDRERGADQDVTVANAEVDGSKKDK